MSNVTENLHPGELRDMVSKIIEVDSYSSKIGSDKDVVVLSFTTEQNDIATDLVSFIERGYDFILDADASPHEAKDGRYKVFAEMERNRHVPEQILEILHGITKLTNIEKFKFRYYKSFKSIPVTKETLEGTIPLSKDDYEVSINENNLNNFSNFFGGSYLDSVNINEDDLIFQKAFSDPLRMRILNAGETESVYESIGGALKIKSEDIAECLFLSKYIGNYNITKIGESFVFENERFAVAMKRI